MNAMAARFASLWAFDRALDQPAFPIRPIKIDTEGHELNLLEGHQLLIEDPIEVQFEFGGACVDACVFFQNRFYPLTPRFRRHRVLSDRLVLLDLDPEVKVFNSANHLCIGREEAA